MAGDEALGDEALGIRECAGAVAALVAHVDAYRPERAELTVLADGAHEHCGGVPHADKEARRRFTGP
eukprot:3240727-Prymnesium_polylepis.2